ncbi:PREDICTED: proteoglycan 3 [Chrysochloris asiatica]|uniref:Proteoglycan 3 n=1 Tax=Chrysochloris asiatica TaxID=185453 RepID=A0A9B0UAT7_CHRAS|nr:PREDICTED: proteoglycan 3 [Chrysochloris asiatica]
MKRLLLLLVLLLGTVSPFHLKIDGPKQESLETVTDLSQDLEGSGEQDGELALTEQGIPSEGEECETDGSEDSLEDEETTESDPAALENFQCPKEEETVLLPGNPGCRPFRALLVHSPQTFQYAQIVCQRCYRGNLISIHNRNLNVYVQYIISRMNFSHVWIGGMWVNRCLRFRWADGSCWNYVHWGPGQPSNTCGHCVSLCRNGGWWQVISCMYRLPFICSY